MNSYQSAEERQTKGSEKIRLMLKKWFINSKLVLNSQKNWLRLAKVYMNRVCLSHAKADKVMSKESAHHLLILRE